MMTMEFKRTAAWRGATKSSAGHRLGVSKLRFAPARSLKADSLGARGLGPALTLAYSSAVPTLVAGATPKGPRLSSFTNRSGRLLDGSDFPANGGEIASRSGLFFASNLQPLSGISNREHHLLEHLLTHRKQTTAPRSNRELSTNRCHDISPSTLPRKRAVPLATFSKCVLFALLIFAVVAAPLAAQEKRKIIIDEDCSGPGGTNTQAILALIQSPDTDVLGITIPTGDAWRDEEVLHALRLLEIIGRTDIPVIPGAAFPLVNSKEYIARWETLYGKVSYQGAWNFAKLHPVHGPSEIPPMPEGAPTTKASTEPIAHFLLRMVHQYPHQVTIYEGGPLTNLALAQAIDPQFASLAKELVLMGGSLNPQTDDPEFTMTPRREFNLWMDPEASRIVLHAPWPRVVVTTVDISLKTKMDKDLISQIGKSQYPAGQYTAKYAEDNYLWDELASVAWLDPSIITKWKKLYLDVSIDHGSSYGDTLVWSENTRPHMGEREVEIQDDLDKPKFYKEFVDLLTRPTPPATTHPDH
jgi:purine nucleosidase